VRIQREIRRESPVIKNESRDPPVLFDVALKGKYIASYEQMSNRVVNETSGFDQLVDHMPAKPQLIIEWE
jgi:hypothetical protein